MPARLPLTCRDLQRSVSVLVSLAFTGCTDTPQEPGSRPAFSNGGSHAISGEVLGPSGNICGSLPSEALVRIQVIDPVDATPAAPFAGSQTLTCPDNQYSIEVASGTYRLRAQLPADPAIGQLPRHHLGPELTVEEDVEHDIQVLNGIPLGGGATLDGAPLAGVALNVRYDFPTEVAYAAASGSSGASGAWEEFFRSPMLLQEDIGYRALSLLAGECGVLGARQLEGLPSNGFLFPGEVSAINCTMETSLATQFTHDRTRLVVTSMAANIGGGEPSLFEQYGRGWGVQFPVDPSGDPVHVPLSASHLFNGGLMIGLEPNVVLIGTTIAQELECGATCVDFGSGATVKVKAPGSKGTVVEWNYSDASSGDGVGLVVEQQSFDGKPPADYVLFKYSIRNRGSSTRTLYAGFWGDWDVGGEATDDVGFTELDRRLMYMTSGGGGIHAGTLLLGEHPVSGTFFYNRASVPISLVDQLRALKGDVRRGTISAADNRAIHAVGPITLEPNKSADVWVAIVAGETRAQLLTNAQAAADDVKKQTLTQSTFQGTLSNSSPDFGEILVVQPSASLPWDGNEAVAFGATPSSYVVSASTSGISTVVPRLPTGPTELLIFSQGTEERTEVANPTIASTFTPVGRDQIEIAPDISGGPFPMSFFIELNADTPDHFLTVAPALDDLPLTVTLDWQNDADLDIFWTDADGSDLGNHQGASLANPEESSHTVPAGETFRLLFNQFGPKAALARVTITSP